MDKIALWTFRIFSVISMPIQQIPILMILHLLTLISKVVYSAEFEIE